LVVAAVQTVKLDRAKPARLIKGGGGRGGAKGSTKDPVKEQVLALAAVLTFPVDIGPGVATGYRASDVRKPPNTQWFLSMGGDGIEPPTSCL
jgi:hypothetical protein